MKDTPEFRATMRRRVEAAIEERCAQGSKTSGLESVLVRLDEAAPLSEAMINDLLNFVPPVAVNVLPGSTSVH